MRTSTILSLFVLGLLALTVSAQVYEELQNQNEVANIDSSAASEYFEEIQPTQFLESEITIQNENESDSEGESESEADSETEVDSELEADSEAEAEVDADSEVDSEADSESESEVDVDAELDNDSEAEDDSSMVEIQSLPTLPSEMPSPSFLESTAAQTPAPGTIAPPAIVNPATQNMDKWSTALNAVNEEIMSRAKEINSEKKWTTQVNKLIDEYSNKHKKVLMNMNNLRTSIKDLLKKKKQIQNAMIQRELKTKIKTTNNHLAKIGGHIDHLKKKQEEFSEKALKLKQLTDDIKKQLKLLQGEKPKSKASVDDILDLKL